MALLREIHGAKDAGEARVVAQRVEDRIDVMTDAKGYATVIMPRWFEALTATSATSSPP